MLEIKDLINLDGKYVYTYILNNKDRLDYLKDKTIKEYFLKEENHYPFIWLVQELDNDGLEIFVDEEMLDMILNSSRAKDKIKELSDKLLLETIIERYFKDITYNFFKNINEIVLFNKNLEDNIIDDKHLNIYRKLLNFYNLSTNEIVELYNTLKNINCEEMYYDDFTKSKEKSYQLFNDQSLGKDNITKLFSKELSNKYNTNVYELNGEDFYAIVHNTGISRENFNGFKEKNIPGATSLSLIGNNNITVYGDAKEGLVVGFYALDTKKIVNVFHSDSFSLYGNEVDTDRIQKIYTPSNFIDNTAGYNEILIQNKENALETKKFDSNYKCLDPDYIVCYDIITDSDIEISKNLNLPIILIHSRFYKEKTTIDFAEDEKYKYSTNELEAIATYKSR